MIRKNPDSGGRNNSLGLPKVSGGQPLSPKVINKLSDGVEKTTIKAVEGFTVNQTNGGTTLRRLNRFKDVTPWSVTVTPTYLIVNTGRFFNFGSQLADVRQYFPNYSTTDEAAKIIPRGGEVTFAEEGWLGSDGLAVTSTADRYGNIVCKENLGEDAVLWIDAWGSAQLHYTPAEEFSGAFGYPIAYIFADNTVVQIVYSDIFAQRARPFQIAAYKKADGEFYVKLNAGGVNSQVPKYKGASSDITDWDTELKLTNTSTGNAGAYIWLKCFRDESADFPTKVEVWETGDLESAANTNSAGWLLVGRVLFKDGGASGKYISNVYNFLNGSVWAEAHKYSTSTTYFFYAV